MDSIIKNMLQFQKQRGVKNQCMTNTQFLYDCLRHSGFVVKVKACLVLSIHNDVIEDENVYYSSNCGGDGSSITTIIHLVVDVNGSILDPSYDVASLKDARYFDSIASYRAAVKLLPIEHKHMKETISRFMEFLNLARRMNAGELLIADKKHYNEQADFVEGGGKSHVLSGGG